MSNARHKKVEEAIKELMDLYEFGQSLDKMIGPVKRISKSQKDQIKKDHPVNDEGILKSIKFFKEYTLEERDRLFQEIRENQSSKAVTEPVFGKIHLFRLLSVSKEKRKKILAKALKECWGLTTLEDEMGIRFGPRKQSGRRIKPAKSFSDFLIRLDSLCESWRRLRNGIPEKAPNGKRKLFSLADLPAKFKARFQEVSDQLFIFHKEVESKLRDFAKERVPRSALENDVKKDDRKPVKG